MSNDKYRLADFVKGYTRNKRPGYWNKIPYIFPESIASKYVLKTSSEDQKDRRIDILDQIVEKNTSDLINVHLRLSDMIIGYKNGVFLWDHNFTRGFQPDSINGFFENAMVNFPGIFDYSDSIIINLYTTLSHFDNNRSINNSDTSLKFIEEIRHNIYAFGFTSKIITEMSADESFTNLCNSRNLLFSAGGFSKLAASLCEYRGGNTYDLING